MARKAEGVIFGRNGRATVAMIPIPSEPGRWFIVSRAAVICECPKCGAQRGEPCAVAPSRKTARMGSECPGCRRVVPRHRAKVCREREDAYRALGGSVYPDRIEHTRCAACGASWGVDPGTAVCPACHAPRTAAAHYAKGADS
jgi:hypothetical protein